MTTKKAKKAPDEIQFTKPISAKEKKRQVALGRAMKYLRENGGAFAYWCPYKWVRSELLMPVYPLRN